MYANYFVLLPGGFQRKSVIKSNFNNSHTFNQLQGTLTEKWEGSRNFMGGEVIDDAGEHEKVLAVIDSKGRWRYN